jgi:type I restriction enzyme M protein
MTNLKQQTNESLKSDMWRACDILRRDNNVGGIIQYTEHIAWLLFLKFLDDEEKRRLEENLLEKDEEKHYKPVLTGELTWDAWASPAILKNTTADDLIRFVRGRLLPGLAALNGQPLAKTIAGIFSDENVGDQTVVRSVPVCASGSNLKDVLDIINKVKFQSQEDIFTITQFYEDLLLQMGNENKIAGEFHTPRPVIKFMVDVLDPQIGESIYDPASGSCGFLAQAFEAMKPNAKTTADRTTLQTETFYGQEKKGISFLLGMMNMVLHGVTAPNNVRANTLEENVSGSVSGRHDIILTNPPFGGTEGKHIQSNFQIKANATELLFMQHIIKKLKRSPSSRCAVVVPEGTLFRGGAFADVKKDLMEQFHLYAMVSLPPGTFAPYSDVKTAILFFQRPDTVLEQNPAARHETWFYELPLPGDLKKFSKGSKMAESDFAEAQQMWQGWRSYLQGKGERPFPFAQDVREAWQAHWTWEAYRNDESGKAEKPEAPAELSEAGKAAFSQEGPRPEEPYSAWVEAEADLMARGYDLSAKNPNQDDRVKLAHPAEITASLLERSREFHNILSNLHEMITGDEA